MRFHGFESVAVLATTFSRISSAQAAFMLDFFNERGCRNSGCLRALSSASDMASADCFIFYTAHRHAQALATTSIDYPVPTYASACNNARRFETACACFGVTPTFTPYGTTTTTLTVPMPTTKTGHTNAIGPRQRGAGTKVVGVELDAPLDLEVLCQGKVADAVAAVEVGVGGAEKTVITTVNVAGTTTVTKSMTTVSVSVSVSVSTKSVSGSCAASSTTARALVANAAAVLAPSSTAAVASSFSVPAGCLSDAQAKAIVGAFRAMLTSEEKASVKKTAEGLLAEEFIGMSSSANSLKGDEASNLTYPDVSSFMAFLSSAPAIPQLTTLDVFHDCNRIAWYWAAGGMVGSSEEERGIHLLYTIDGGVASLSDGVGGDDGGEVNLSYGGKKVNMMMFEFDSLGWAEIEKSV